MKEALWQIVTAAIGTLGFSIYFRVNEKHVAVSTVGGALGWGIYLLMFHYTSQLFAANFVATLVVYIYSEICARIFKAPANVFLIPGIIPLLPGNALYYTMRGLVDSNSEMMKTNGINTLAITFGIAAGIVVGTMIIPYFLRLKNKTKKSNR
ncbi:MAG: threonine/serine exporter family protein [Clostridiales bacterium]|nr:threonine/serine exporter family protein [Clostridiales bacterium]